VPFALIYLFGQIYHVNSSDPGPSGIPVAVVNQSDNPAAARLVEALRAEKTFKVLTKFVNPDKTTRPLAEGDLRALMHADKFRFALVIPKDVIRPEDIGIHLKTYSNPRNEVEAETVEGILQKTIFSKVPELLGQSLQARARSYLGDARLDRFNTSIASAVAGAFGGDEADIKAHMADGELGFRRLDTAGASAPVAAQDSGDALSRIVKIDNVQVAGAGIKSPMATLLVGGMGDAVPPLRRDGVGDGALPREGAWDIPAGAVGAGHPGRHPLEQVPLRDMPRARPARRPLPRGPRPLSASRSAARPAAGRRVRLSPPRPARRSAC
jgi:ABC-2 type transport system permease protein